MKFIRAAKALSLLRRRPLITGIVERRQSLGEIAFRKIKSGASGIFRRKQDGNIAQEYYFAYKRKIVGSSHERIRFTCRYLS